MVQGWPPEYGGPVDVLDMRRVRWVAGARIVQRESGAWEWTCRPIYLRNDAIADLARLIEAGWDVRINPLDAGRFRVDIREMSEAPQSARHP
ncbi:hypothetical protein [Microbacterium sp. A1-JK]|uniref:hypothetical protein n=1 Tax=Microbacterium sp. A1-JK TaxID=3177516 RepID=UPI003887DCAB